MTTLLETPGYSEKLHDSIEKKLSEYGWGEEAASLADFVLVMLSNGKTQTEINEELVDLIGSDFDTSFSLWLFNQIEELEKSKNASVESVSKIDEIDFIEKESTDKSQQSFSVPETSIQPQSSQTPNITSLREEKELPTGRVGQKLKLTSQKQRFNPMAASFNYSKSVMPAAKRALTQTQEVPLCKYADKCSRANCIFAHPTPAAAPGEGMVLSSEMCASGKECKAADCVKGHPSPATVTTLPPFMSMSTIPIPCKYKPCLNPACRFIHPTKSRNMTWRPPSKTEETSLSERSFAVNESEEQLHVPSV
ncbi:Nuclear polyadenylated RNA-binding protein nab2 [Schizosaccharomyces pombe]|uniref:Nuclear polyadenylated RNA-binding protein nab2 n=1 Tax=Schizosaccharomyces pombe (strain 972 / ATCC 24843) TaxID=284812 RepID=NAB2_SCHPO|nr:putative poly(A)-binding protein Nab2 [Schizosaccharomyces pombe]O13713.1 RecName: Full=Nuclear polyadenylated RNA-binding protein nab2 [Schizosaccharomyces pombe 972h-]CAB11199.1 poly(A) binding protein Nab2 (predicted) [Schizosaccharomyces pombe]|eukprot:NP_594911.1 putative poly(A)-binding protein Nab2 [Schizosaccharomyces pombe]